MDSRDELLVQERPREVVVAAGERADADGRIGVAEHDHRAVRHDATLERGRIAEQEQVGLGRARQLLGSRERQHVEPVAHELALEKPANGRLGLGEEQGCHGRRR